MDMVRAEGRHLSTKFVSAHWTLTKIPYEVVAMVIAILASHPYLDLIVPRVSRSLQEVLRQELSLLIEVVPGTLCSQK